MNVIAVNKKAGFDYFIEDRFEAGIVLQGSEIKSIRQGNVSLKESFVKVIKNEMFIVNMHIKEFDKASHFGHDPKRTRKLLVNKKQIKKIEQKINVDGYSIVPLRLYIKGQYAKLEIALAKGKKQHEKRETIKKKEIQRQISNKIKEFNQKN